MKLDNTIHPSDLAEAIEQGYVRRQRHPELPLTILNYTQKAQFENVWTPAVCLCRGIIVADDGQIVARPFPKFFNYGQPGAAPLDLQATVSVTDKVDGSLGILYPTPDGYAVATRGSFTSDQALHATALYREKYARRFAPSEVHTYLVEIVYPSNRVVIDYKDFDDLILLGAVGNVTGRIVAASDLYWPGPRVSTFEAATLAEALALPPRPNAEGIVVRCTATDQMLKIKQEDYLALHRIVTHLTARTVWEHLVAGRPLGELIEPLPDEFHPWVRQVADGILDTVDQRAAAIDAAYDRLVGALPPDAKRREFAAEAIRQPDSWALFFRYDGRNPRPMLLKHARPDAFQTPNGAYHTEDNS